VKLEPLLLDLSFYLLNVERAALAAACSTSRFALKASVDQLADIKNSTGKYYPDNDFLYHKAQNYAIPNYLTVDAGRIISVRSIRPLADGCDHS
jgi:hypothetical protein